MSTESGQSQPYRVLARKYRPQTFDDLIGQAPMVQTLSNAFRLGRIAQAYMLTGVRGVGKTTTARILARALNFAKDGENQPNIELADEGDHCRAIMEGRHMDVVEMDAASHTGIDDIRDLIESAQYRPATAQFKVYIIDEVHMLSKSAFNGLLKTLEEPPSHLKFIFATTEIRKVPVTVLSRCQRFDLRRIEAGMLADHLNKICELEKVECEAEALAIISRAAEGSVRDALSMLDQAIAHGAAEGDGKILAESMRQMLGLSDRTRIVGLFEQIMRGKLAEALTEMRAQYDTGADPQAILTDLADFVHLVTRAKYVPDAINDSALSETERTRGKEFAEALSVPVLGRAWQILLKGIDEVGASERGLPAAEMVLVRLAHASSLPTPDELAKMQSGTTEPVPKSDPLHAPNGGARNDDGQNSAIGNALPPEIKATPPTTATPVEASRDNTVLAMTPPSPAHHEPSDADQTANKRPLNRFDELIFLVEDKRDLKLKSQIARHVRLVSFADGRMEMNLVENAPRDFLPTLAKRLEEWTGRRWVLSISKEEGAPTLYEQEQAESKANLESARTDPAVEAILSQFPGAKIVDVKIKNEPGQDVIAPPDEDGDN